jgi:predicted RNA-binding Zn ribbon-like protein
VWARAEPAASAAGLGPLSLGRREQLQPDVVRVPEHQDVHVPVRFGDRRLGDVELLEVALPRLQLGPARDARSAGTVLSSNLAMTGVDRAASRVVDQAGDRRAAFGPVFDLAGGALCLDFANTLDDRPEPRPVERLASYADLLAFARATGALPDTQLAALDDQAARRPADAELALARARALREVVFRLFLALAEGGRAPAADLAGLNRALGEALGHARVVARDAPTTDRGAAEGGRAGGPAAGGGDGRAAGGFSWGWTDDRVELEAPLWPVVRSAADLLTSPALATLRVCASETCAWLFLDTGRNGSRRWCSMRTCGNRARARRHHARVRAAGTAAVASSAPSA